MTHKLMRYLVVITGFVIPIIFGHWRYRSTSEPNPIIQGIWIALLSSFFSLGLWLSVNKIGRKLKYLTLFLIFLGAVVHFVFAIYPFIFIPAVLSIEVYAAISLFRRNSIRNGPRL